MGAEHARSERACGRAEKSLGGWQQDELELALKLGVAPRRLSGWEPTVVTRYEYDDEGRLIGAVQEREAEWSSEDRAALIAYLEMGRVGPHGHPMSEATSPDGDPSNPNRTFDWVVPLPRIDFAQQVLDSAVDAFRKNYPDANLSAYKFRVEKRPL